MINIIKYHEDYDKILKEFEQSSAIEIGEGFPYTHIKSATKFNFRFSSKYESYGHSEILLGLDKKTSEILATAIYSLKTMPLGGENTKVIQILVIKVHPEVRHTGIATKLLRFIEKQAVKNEIPVLVAKLNYGSSFAHKLFFNKFAFTETSCVKMSLISDSEACDDVVKVDKRQAVEMIKEFYFKKDAFPEDFQKIFDSPAFLGTFMLEKDGEYVAASLWNVSYYSEVQISHVILDKKYLKDNFSYVRAWTVMLFTICIFCYLWKWAYDYFEEKAYKISSFVFFLFIAFHLVQWFFTIAQYLRKIRTSPKPRLRIFAVCYNNSLEPKKPLLKTLFNHLSSIHESEYTSFEYHEDDIFHSIFPLYSFRKIFMQKNVQNSLVFKWNKRHFIDPRE